MINAEILALAGLRIDGRRYDEIRQIRHNIGFDKTGATDGSVYFELGLNKVCVFINGPHEASLRSDIQHGDKGRINCTILQTSNHGDRKMKKSVNSDRKTLEIENVIKQTFSSVILLEQYSKSDIDITCHVLESDG
jgi:exosome complex component RRP41